MYYTNQHDYIRGKAKEYGPVCEADLKSYQAHAALVEYETGVSHLNKDGYPNLVRTANKDPEFNKIRFWLAARREAWVKANPNPAHITNYLAKRWG